MPICLVSGYGIRDILFSTSRKRHLVFARRLAFWMVRTMGCYSNSEIGRALGHDHTTIRLAVIVVGESLEKRSDPYYPLLKDVLEVDDELRRT